MRSVLFLLGSSRAAGNTETLARLAAETLPADVRQRWLWLEDLPLPDFHDVRHTAQRIPPEPTGNERLLLEATLEATDIVIASPLYWYSVSASVKRYLDYWSGWLYLPNTSFKAVMSQKTLWGVSVAEELGQEEHLVGTLRRSAHFLKMRWGGVLVGNGNRPDDVLNDAPALVAAKSFFQDL
jgi:multimeric flavodoxin WrbA